MKRCNTHAPRVLATSNSATSPSCIHSLPTEFRHPASAPRRRQPVFGSIPSRAAVPLDAPQPAASYQNAVRLTRRRSWRQKNSATLFWGAAFSTNHSKAPRHTLLTQLYPPFSWPAHVHCLSSFSFFAFNPYLAQLSSQGSPASGPPVSTEYGHSASHAHALSANPAGPLSRSSQ